MITMPEPAPFGAVGELIVLQAQARGAVGMLVDVAVRDIAELKEIGLPIWARFVRVRGTKKADPGRLDVPVVVGGATIRPGDVVVMDDDGVVVVAAERVEEVAEAARAREEKESRLRSRLRAGSSPTTCSGYVPRKETDVEDPDRGSLAAGAPGQVTSKNSASTNSGEYQYRTAGNPTSAPRRCRRFGCCRPRVCRLAARLGVRGRATPQDVLAVRGARTARTSAGRSTRPPLP